MKETVESIAFIVAVLVLVVVLPLFTLRKLRLKRNAQLAAADERYMKRLLTPDINEFMGHFGCPPPAPLRRLYENPDNILDGGFEMRIASFRNPFEIAEFLCMDRETISIELPGAEPHFAFATDGCGNFYTVDPRETDPTVYFHDHEMGQPESLKLSLSQFLATKRTKCRW